MQLEQLSRRTPDFQVLFESVPALYLVLSPTFTIVAVSDAYLAIAMAKREDIVGQKVFDVFPNHLNSSERDSITHLRASLERVLCDKNSNVMAIQKYDIRKPESEGGGFEEWYWRPVNSPIVGADGQVDYIIYRLEDVTEFIGLRMEVLGQLTGDLAHYVNNLLGSVLGNIEMMEQKTTPQGEEYRQATIETITRGAEFIRALMAFSRRQPLNPAIIDVNTHLAGVAKTLQRMLSEQVDITLKIEPNVWSVRIDPQQLETAVIHLAMNARNAMPHGGGLTISTRNEVLKKADISQGIDAVPGNYVCVEVADVGCGMPGDIMAHIFDPFFTTKGIGKAMGLGLSIVHGFIKQSGGHIKVHSEVGRGTSVEIYLPSYEGDTAKLDARDADDTPVGHGETILVVEDDPDMRHLTAKQLESLGYKTIEAANGRQALEVIDGNVKCDMLFSDIAIPGEFSGFDIAKKIWKRDPSIHILLTSGFSNGAVHEKREITPGVHAEFLGKPYRKGDLARKVHGILGGLTPKYGAPPIGRELR